jgi:hypothetical protein
MILFILSDDTARECWPTSPMPSRPFGKSPILKRFTLSFLLLALLFPGGAPAETDDKVPVEIIELQHRSADDLLPHIAPLLGPRDTLTGTGHRLIVRTSPGRLRQVRELVEELDRPDR